MNNKLKLPLLSAVSLLTLSSCGHIFTKSEGYAESSVAKVNDADVNAAFYPNGGSGGFAVSAMVYMAGAAKLEGPFLWRVQAKGVEGNHETLTVHRVKVVTEKTKRSEWFPTKYLNKPQDFTPYKKTPGVTYAYFQMPGELKIMPKKDGNISVFVDLSIKSKTQTKRKSVSFKLSPSTTSDTEFIFIPTEIIDGFSKDPREWELDTL